MRQRLLLAAEIVAIIAWGLFITRPYQNPDLSRIPASHIEFNEYLALIPPNHFWTWAKECGWCALWNGSLNGGIPALADPYSSFLHPVVALPILLVGVPFGTKLSIVGAFIMAGLAQWWLARVLGLGRVARLWSAGMVMVAGHLAARMELGFYGLVISTAACSLVLPPLVALARHGSRRMAVVLGITLGLAAIAGQGYLQIALIFCFPALLIIMPREGGERWQRVRRYALAGVLAALFAAPLLLPLFHFMPNYTKYTDPQFESGQPFAYVLFNLVIDDPDFYSTRELGKLPYAYLYGNYVGWIPLAMALWALRGGRSGTETRTIIYLLVITLIPLVMISDWFLPALAGAAPAAWIAEQIQGMRYFSSMGGMAIPPLLALAAIGLDKLLHERPWRSLRDPRWLLAAPLLLALWQGWSYGTNWIRTIEMRPEVYPVLRELQTDDLQWIRASRWYHSHFIEPGVGMGFKFSQAYRPYQWKGREDPEPIIFLQYSEIPPEGMSLREKIDVVHIFALPPGNEYATVTHADGSRTICTAHGTGGSLDVLCDTPRPGRLTVKENNWVGWHASVDGAAVDMPAPTDEFYWLTVAELPAGRHTIRFRYRPWDVPLALVLFAGGLVLAGWQWRRRGGGDV